MPLIGKSNNMLLHYSHLMLLYMFFSVNDSIGSDTISLGQSLSDGQTIISKGGKFELGFFSPGNSSNRYMGIWYKNISVSTVVWVANRDNPIASVNNSLVLSNGGLNVHNGLRGIIWATSLVVKDSNVTEAILFDTGNFVLRGPVGVLWQSFDYPTDTWLPGGRVGFDKTNNRSLVLTSWRNSEDPALGIYSLGIDPIGSAELLMWRNLTRRYWRSGIWNGLNFTLVPQMSVSGTLYNFSYVSNVDTNYFTFNASRDSTMRVVIDFQGRIQALMWSERIGEWVVYTSQPSDICATYELCGSFGVCSIEVSPVCSCLRGFVPRFPKDWELSDFSGGCVRRTALQCNEDKEAFVRLTNISPAYSQSLAVGNTKICEFACSINCSCNAYSYSSSGGCLLWTGDLLDLQDRTNGGDFYLKLDASQIPDIDRSRNKKKRHVAILVSLAALVISFSFLCFLWLRRRKLKRTEAQGKNQDLLLLNLDNSSKPNTHIINQSVEEKVLELPMFSFSSISAATNKFSAANKLGEGGFGPVYKGSLLNGQSVAVKRLSKMSRQGLEELRNEAVLIAKLQHRNLVRLLGCCTEKDEKILIYEHMPNKSLDSFLFDPNKQELLNWTRRVQIIEGIAQGLLYLHEYSRLRIVHRDLKASNILLDGDMKPKISDFGMARIFGGHELQANTNRIVGTYGYMSPEYAMEGRFSVKSDVFAFGVLLLEILSGRKNTGFQHSDCLSLLGYTWKLHENERALELIDPILQIPSSSSMPLRYILVGLLCAQESPDDRPTISDVIAMLSNEHTALASPKRPAFTAGRTLLFANSDRSKAENCSINNLTASVMEAR